MLKADGAVEVIDHFQVIFDKALSNRVLSKNGFLEKAALFARLKEAVAGNDLTVKEVVLEAFSSYLMSLGDEVVLADEIIYDIFKNVLMLIEQAAESEALSTEIKHIVSESFEKIFSEEAFAEAESKRALLQKNKEFIYETLDRFNNSEAKLSLSEELSKRAVENIWVGLRANNQESLSNLVAEFATFDKQSDFSEKQKSQFKTAFLLKLVVKNSRLLEVSSKLSGVKSKEHVINYLKVNAINFNNLANEFKALCYQCVVGSSLSVLNNGRGDSSAKDVSQSLVPLAKVSNLSYGDISFLGRLVDDFVAKYVDRLAFPSSQAMKYTLFLAQLKLVQLRDYSTTENTTLNRNDFLKEIKNIFDTLEEHGTRAAPGEFANQVAQTLGLINEGSAKIYKSVFIDFVAKNIERSHFTEVATAFVYARVIIVNNSGEVEVVGVSPAKRRAKIDWLKALILKRF